MGTGIPINTDINDVYTLRFVDVVSSVADTVLNVQRRISCIEELCIYYGKNVHLVKSKLIISQKGGPLRGQ